tara:strand:+ start:632 stop:1507 length:876 start_codon:yes stop_codon:yes gene_type:complete
MKNKSFYVLNVEFENKNLGNKIGIRSKRATNDEIDEIKRKLSEFSCIQVVKIGENLEILESKSFEKEKLKELAESLGGFLVITPLACHRIALQHALKQEAINANDITWISGSRIMRRIKYVSENKDRYQGYRNNAYDIEKLAKLARIEFKENAICETFGELLSGILESESISLKSLWKKVKNEKIRSVTSNIQRRGAPNCPFSGQSIKFSGKISSDADRLDGAHWAAGLGFSVVNSKKWAKIYVRGDSTIDAYNRTDHERDKDKEYDHKLTTQQFLDLVAQELKPYKKTAA